MSLENMTPWEKELAETFCRELVRAVIKKGVREMVNVREIAHEAHMMGRIYAGGGEKILPAEEFERVEEMVKAKLALNKPKGESE